MTFSTDCTEVDLKMLKTQPEGFCQETRQCSQTHHTCLGWGTEIVSPVK